MRWLERYSLGPWGWKGGLLATAALLPLETYSRYLMLDIDPGPPFLYYLPGYWITALGGGLIPGVVCSIASLFTADWVFIEPRGGITLIVKPATTIRGGMNCLTGIVFSIAIHYFQKTTVELRRANLAATLLKRELNHRVGNFLQSIQAVCMMHKRKYPDNESLDAICYKLHTLGQVHNMLQNEDAEFDNEHIRTVVEAILQERNCKINVDCDISVSRDRVQPLMLIVNELALNTNKHQTAEQPCEITVNFHRDGMQNVLTYCDKGKGKPKQGTGIGVQIIEAMAQQLGGSVEFAENPKARITFPA